MSRFDRNRDSRSSESRADYEKRRAAGAARREEERREQLRRQQEMREKEEAYRRRVAYERAQQEAWRPENPEPDRRRANRGNAQPNQGRGPVQGGYPNQRSPQGQNGYPNQRSPQGQSGYPNQRPAQGQNGYPNQRGVAPQGSQPNQGRGPVPVAAPGREPYPGTEEGRGRKKKKGGRAGSIISTIILLVALAVFAVAAWKLVGFYLDYKAGSDEYANLNNQYVQIDQAPQQDIEVQENETEPIAGKVLQHLEELEDPAKRQALVDQAAKEEAVENQEKKQLPTLVNPINFDELTQVNDEIIGWIRLGALNISYPVAQAADNDYYLHRTFERQDNFAGCIFLNCENSKFFTDMNSVVYGHNMKNGSMFGNLKDMGKQEIYDKNPYFWIFTPQLIYQYRIFSCGTVPVQGDPYKIRFLREDFEAFIQNRQENSLVDNHGVEVDADDRIVTLSTCTSDDTTRFIAQGVLEQVYIAK